MNIKVIFLDIDDTFYDHSHSIFPASAIKGLNMAANEGIRIVIASGRNIALIKEIGADARLPVSAYIAANGAMVHDKTGKLLFDHAFKQEDMDYIFQECAKHNIGIQYINQEVNYCTIPLNEHIKKSCDDFKIPYPKYRPYQGERICQLFLFADNDEAKEMAYAFKFFRLHRFHPFCVDVFDADNNKGTAVRKYLEIEGISPDEAMAFGDANNDIQMLETVKYSVAMGNATDELKAVASYVTTPVYDNGIYNALVHFGIIKE